MSKRMNFSLFLGLYFIFFLSTHTTPIIGSFSLSLEVQKSFALEVSITTLITAPFSLLGLLANSQAGIRIARRNINNLR